MPSDLFIMDSRVPVSPSADKSSPNHPENVTKNAIMLQRQAQEDGSQDIKVPIRNPPQGFENPVTSLRLPPLFLLLLAILVGSVLIGVAVCRKMNMLPRFLLAIGAMCVFRYAASLVPSI